MSWMRDYRIPFLCPEPIERGGDGPTKGRLILAVQYDSYWKPMGVWLLKKLK